MSILNILIQDWKIVTSRFPVNNPFMSNDSSELVIILVNFLCAVGKIINKTIFKRTLHHVMHVVGWISAYPLITANSGLHSPLASTIISVIPLWSIGFHVRRSSIHSWWFNKEFTCSNHSWWVMYGVRLLFIKCRNYHALLSCKYI